MNSPFRSIWCVAAPLALATGCQLPPPDLTAPGPAPQQQYEATNFDPYPDYDAGPPVLGGRPSSYDKPIAEPSRLRSNPWVPAPGGYAGYGGF